MSPRNLSRAWPSLPGDHPKAPTGIAGLDEITGGGWPRGKTTLIEGGAGSGKTIIALQTLVNGATLCGEPGIFVAFEERSKSIIANAETFGWDLPELQRRRLFFLDAQPNPRLIQSGGFDLAGMLAALSAKADEIKARRIVFDSVDIVLHLLNDPRAERREIYQLHEWLLNRRLTAIITGKRSLSAALAPLEFMQFMVDCAVLLRHEVVQGVSQRNLRVLKYRGTSFDENETPFVIGRSGLDVASSSRPEPVRRRGLNRRLSSGIKRLDTVLGGGYHAGSSVLITGVPGTAKSTLGGAFVEAACRRGHRAVFLSFDTEADQVVRNLTSVNIQLGRFVQQGLLRVVSARSTSASAEVHLMRIKRLVEDHRTHCLVVDPVSGLSKAGNHLTAHGVSERLLDWAKAQGITLLCTSLVEPGALEAQALSIPISTIADTWIHLSYVIRAGERNRCLSIVKSRGTWHSNQVRELLLGSQGVTLTDVYTAGGEVLMGTLRWEKERSERIARSEQAQRAGQQLAQLDLEESELAVRLKGIELQLAAKRLAREGLAASAVVSAREDTLNRRRLRELRGVEAPSRATR